jgi:hypothetical protein
VVAKVYGFLTGAGITAVAILGFNVWRHVSDEDRLELVLTEHCLPYVSAGVTPFDGMGRTIGVYDGITTDERITNGGAAVLFDARFVAEWGEIAEPPVRFCTVYGSTTDAAQQVFDVAPDGFIGRVSSMIEPFGDLRPDVAELDTTGGSESLVRSIAWREQNGPNYGGLNVTMTTAGGLIAEVMVFKDLVQKP